MGGEPRPRRLDEISTAWTVLRLAHAGDSGAADAARQLLVERYRGAVSRYLLGALRDPEAADDLTQEFALALVRGDFRGADRGKGRFRSYLKVVLSHLVGSYRKRQKKLPRALAGDHPAWESLASPGDDPSYDACWREELLKRGLKALAEAQPLWHAVLQYHLEHPGLTSAQQAEEFGRELGRPFTAESLRQLRHRARSLFGELLLAEVSFSLRQPTAVAIEEELAALDLLKFCRRALEQLRRRGA
jgi:RNA polymerase sigma factor (sigma-70 family)